MTKEKYEIFVSATYIYVDNKEKAIKLAKSFLELGADVAVRIKSIDETKK